MIRERPGIPRGSVPATPRAWPRGPLRRCEASIFDTSGTSSPAPLPRMVIRYEHNAREAPGLDPPVRIHGGRPQGAENRTMRRDGTGRTMRQGRVLLADSHLPMLQGVRSLLESLFA